MRVKLDEDMPRAVADLLLQHGHDAVTVADEALCGSTDSSLWTVVQSEGRLLITADKGFADIRLHPPGTHAGVLLLRPDEEGIPAIASIMAGLLRETDLETLGGAVAVATPRGLRVRRSSS